MLFQKYPFLLLLLTCTNIPTNANSSEDLPIIKGSSTPDFYCVQQKLNNHTTFPATASGAWAVPIEIITAGNEYLNNLGSILVRRCLYNGTWAMPRSYPLSGISVYLYNATTWPNANSALGYANYATYFHRAKITTIDLHFISSILVQSAKDLNITANARLFIETIDNLLWIDTYHMAVAQEFFNSTDRILSVLTQYLNGNSQNATNFNQTRMTINSMDGSNNTGGMFLWTDKHVPKFATFGNTNPLEEMKRNDVITAFQVFHNRNNCHDSGQLANFHAMFFLKDAMFPKNYMDFQFPTPIVSILLPENYCYTVRVFYKDFQCNFNRTCDYWHYGSEGDRHLQGHWSSVDVPENPRRNIFVCNYTKGQHFSMVRMAKYGRECAGDVLPNLNLTFPATGAGTCGLPLELCLQDDYTPVKRYCYPNATWGQVLGTCSKTVRISNTTIKLYKLFREQSGDTAPADYVDIGKKVQECWDSGRKNCNH